MTPISARAEPSSFRDPSGSVYRIGDRIFRTVTDAGATEFEKVWQAGILQKMTAQGRMIDARLLPDSDPVRNEFSSDHVYILTHPMLPLITYPYEWPFHALRSAALAHIELQLALLDEGFVLSDASAFNMQFDGARPLHIDTLSVIPYREGMPWNGYRQFLHHFLNPLFLEAKTGVSFATFFRATLDGVTSDDLLRLLPWHAFWRPGLFLHIVAPALGERHFLLRDPATGSMPPALSKTRYRGLLRHLHHIIETLKPCRRRTTLWAGYTGAASYARSEIEIKRALVRSFIQSRRPQSLLDIGCNTGDYAVLALEAGAGRVIGLDSDRASVDAAFERSSACQLRFTPLAVDISNPSPAQGWRGTERESLTGRLRADAVIALAIMHHLCIGRNIPLAEAIGLIVSLAPCGLVEFVPKSDPQVADLLRFRQDIFPDYHLEAMQQFLSQHARIIAQEPVGDSGRTLFQFEHYPCQ